MEFTRPPLAVQNPGGSRGGRGSGRVLSAPPLHHRAWVLWDVVLPGSGIIQFGVPRDGPALTGLSKTGMNGRLSIKWVVSLKIQIRGLC